MDNPIQELVQVCSLIWTNKRCCMGVHASTRTSVVSMKQHLWFSSVHQYKQHLVWCSCLVLSLCSCFKLCDLAWPASRMAQLICACPLTLIQTVTVTKTQENKLKANGAKRTPPPSSSSTLHRSLVHSLFSCISVILFPFLCSVWANPSYAVLFPRASIIVPVSLKTEGQRGGHSPLASLLPTMWRYSFYLRNYILLKI